MSSHFLQHLFAEDLSWRFPSKALARRIVEAITDHLHIVICALPDIAFAGQPPSKASVSVLDCAFLPGAGGVAEHGVIALLRPWPVMASECLSFGMIQSVTPKGVLFEATDGD